LGAKKYKPRCANSCGCTNYYLTGDIAKTDGIANELYNDKNKLFMKKFSLVPHLPIRNI